MTTTTATTERPTAVFFQPPIAREKPRERAHFLFCNSCFWCASGLGPARTDRCPGCGAVIETLSIMPNETYRMKMNKAGSGVELDFTTTTAATSLA